MPLRRLRRWLPGWDSPWGRGRPGWHIECSAMAAAHLGETIDIHAGGVDLQFPHHENEIAQSTCAHHGAPFCRYWLHNGFVNVDHTKMSKSLGNIVLVRDLLKQAPGEAIRLALLSAHYRTAVASSRRLTMPPEPVLRRRHYPLAANPGIISRGQGGACVRGVLRGCRHGAASSCHHRS